MAPNTVKETVMNWLRRWFGKNDKAASSATGRSPSYRIGVEQLEDRRVMSVSYNGGAVISHVQVDTVYYGQDWETSSGQANAQSLNRFMSTVTRSSYMGMLGEYNVGLGNFDRYDFVTDGSAPTAGTTVTEDQIQYMLEVEIYSGRLPMSDGNHLYFVYLPPNVTSQYDLNRNLLGHHSAFSMYDYNTGTLAPVYYAVIPNPIGNPVGYGYLASLGTFNQQTEVSSHELAEAVTNPNWGGWWDSDSYSRTYGEEIGDLANLEYGNFDGYVMQKVWLNSMNSGFLPSWNSAAVLGTDPNSPYLWHYEPQDYNGHILLWGWNSGHWCAVWQIAPGDYSGWFPVT
jgi:hypothetical protein